MPFWRDISTLRLIKLVACETCQCIPVTWTSAGTWRVSRTKLRTERKNWGAILGTILELEGRPIHCSGWYTIAHLQCMDRHLRGMCKRLKHYSTKARFTNHGHPCEIGSGQNNGDILRISNHLGIIPRDDWSGNLVCPRREVDHCRGECTRIATLAASVASGHSRI